MEILLAYRGFVFHPVPKNVDYKRECEPNPRTKVGPLAIVWKLKKQGRKESTLASISKRLRYLVKNVEVDEPEKVKEFIANLQCSDGYEDNLIDAYSHYAKFYSIQWTKPNI